MMIRILTLTTLIAATLLSGSAGAEVIRFRLSGTIDVSDPFNVLPDGIESGMPFTGTFAYDLDAVDLFPDDPQRGRYQFGPHAGELGFSVRIGAHEFRTDPTLPFALNLGNDVLLGVSLSGEPIPPLGDFISGHLVGIFPIPVEFPSFRFDWYDLTLSTFSSDDLPKRIDLHTLTSVDRFTAVLLIDGFQIGTVTTGPRWFQIHAAIDSLAPIPEPSATEALLTALLSYGFAAFVAIVSRRKKGVDYAMAHGNWVVRFFMASLAIGVFAGSASGELIRFRLSGTIDVSDPFNVLPDGIESGMPFFGTFAYDLHADDQRLDDPRIGQYIFSAPTDGMGFEIDMDSYRFRTNNQLGFGIYVYDDFAFSGIDPPPPMEDAFAGTFDAEFPFPVEFSLFSFYWRGTSLDTFTDDTLPTTLNSTFLNSPGHSLPVLEMNGSVAGTVTTGPRFFKINAFIDSISVVPEPSTQALISFAVVVFVFRVSSRRRRKLHPHPS